MLVAVSPVVEAFVITEVEAKILLVKRLARRKEAVPIDEVLSVRGVMFDPRLIPP